MKRPITFLFGMLLFLTACTYSSSSTKFPRLKDEAAVTAEIDQLVTSGGYDLSGMTMNENGNVSTELTVQVYNPQDLPKARSAREAKALNIAGAVKDHLENAADFTHYKVEFVLENGVTEWYTFPSASI